MTNQLKELIKSVTALQDDDFLFMKANIDRMAEFRSQSVETSLSPKQLAELGKTFARRDAFIPYEQVQKELELGRFEKSAKAPKTARPKNS